MAEIQLSLLHTAPVGQLQLVRQKKRCLRPLPFGDWAEVDNWVRVDEDRRSGKLKVAWNFNTPAALLWLRVLGAGIGGNVVLSPPGSGSTISVAGDGYPSVEMYCEDGFSKTLLRRSQGSFFDLGPRLGDWRLTLPWPKKPSYF